MELGGIRFASGSRKGAWSPFEAVRTAYIPMRGKGGGQFWVSFRLLCGIWEIGSAGWFQEKRWRRGIGMC